MAAVGFSHRDMSRDAGRSANADYLAYVAAGGSAEDLCDHDTHNGGADHGNAGTGCEACRLVASVLLPGQDALPEAWDAPRAARLWPGDGWRLTLAFAYARPGPRAPPHA